MTRLGAPLRQREIVGVATLGVGMSGDEEGAVRELGVAQGLAELIQARPRLGKDLGGIEGEEDLDIDIRRLRLLDELRHLVACFDRDLPSGLELAQLGIELLLLGLALRRLWIEAAGLDRGQPLDDDIGALHVLRHCRRRENETGDPECGHCRYR